MLNPRPVTTAAANSTDTVMPSWAMCRRYAYSRSSAPGARLTASSGVLAASGTSSACRPWSAAWVSYRGDVRDLAQSTSEAPPRTTEVGGSSGGPPGLRASAHPIRWRRCAVASRVASGLAWPPRDVRQGSGPAASAKRGVPRDDTGGEHPDEHRPGTRPPHVDLADPQHLGPTELARRDHLHRCSPLLPGRPPPDRNPTVRVPPRRHGRSGQRGPACRPDWSRTIDRGRTVTRSPAMSSPGAARPDGS